MCHFIALWANIFHPPRCMVLALMCWKLRATQSTGFLFTFAARAFSLFFFVDPPLVSPQ